MKSAAILCAICACIAIAYSSLAQRELTRLRKELSRVEAQAVSLAKQLNECPI